jgi:hypothetical protein
VSDFGDWEPDDAIDHEPPAPEQIAYRLYELRQDVENLIGRPLPEWDELSADEQASIQSFGAFIVDWLADNPDPDNPEPLAHALHDLRQVLNPQLADWDDLSDDEHEIGEELMALILNWLRRQGAIA